MLDVHVHRQPVQIIYRCSMLCTQNPLLRRPESQDIHKSNDKNTNLITTLMNSSPVGINMHVPIQSTCKYAINKNTTRHQNASKHINVCRPTRKPAEGLSTPTSQFGPTVQTASNVIVSFEWILIPAAYMHLYSSQSAWKTIFVPSLETVAPPGAIRP